MKKFYLLPILVLSAFTVDAKNLTVNGQEYAVDTLVPAHQVGPGTKYAHYRVTARPMEIHVLEMDLTNPYLTMEVWNGGQAAVACETPTSVYSRYQKDGLQVVAAHNGDFFTTNLGETGISRMGLIGAGDVIFNPTGNPLFVIDEENRPWIDYVNFSGTLTAGEASTRIHTVNQLRLEWEPGTQANQLSLYTPAFGSKMHANSSGGTVAVLKPVSGSVAFPVNKPIQMSVVERLANPGQIAIPEDGAVLHGVGSSAAWLDGLQAGQVVTVTLGASLPSYSDVKTIRDAIGGSGHIILRNGQITNINNPDCHPRTFMGISKDAKTIWSVIVDGRWASSAGIDLDDEGRVLQWLGAWDGINLDGGGSSCMVVNEEIKNHPSDGPERAVGNGVIFYSTSPVDNEVSWVAFPPGDYKFPVGAEYSPKLYGFNKYGVLQTKNVSNFTLSTDDPLGTISSDNKSITMSTTPAKGTLSAKDWGSLTTASIPVEVVFVQAESPVTNLVVSNSRNLTIPLTSTVGPHKYIIDPTTVEWKSEDPEIVNVFNGQLCGMSKNGVTTITGQSDHFKGSFTVTHESYGDRIGGYTNKVFDGIPAEKFNLKQTGGKNISASENGEGFNLTYTGNGVSRGCYIQIGDSTGKISTHGTPDVIYLTINPGDAPINQITMNYSDQLGNRGTITFEAHDGNGTLIPLEPNKTLTLTAEIPCEEAYSYPFTFSGLRFTMGVSTSNKEYKIEIPEFYYMYPALVGADDIKADQTPVSVPEGTFDLNGRRVSDEPTAPGLYIKNGEKILVK